MMDPKQTLNRLLQAILSGDLEMANECIEAYREWRLKGGFSPEVLVMGDHLWEALCALCAALEERQ